MEVGGNPNTGSSLPPNYVSLFELRERWLQKKAAEQREREKTEEEKQKSEEERRSEAQVHGRAKKEEYGSNSKVGETPQTTGAQSRPSNKLHGPKQKRKKRSGNYGRTASDRVPEPASKETEAEAAAQVGEATKKVGGVVEWERNHGREKKRDKRRSHKKTSGSQGRAGTGADPESEKRAAMAVPVVGRRERGRGIGVYDSGIAEGKATEKKSSVDRFSEEGPCRRRQKETSRSQGRAGAGAGAGADAESEKRAAMVVPVVGRGERERGIGVYDSEVAEGKGMERKGSVDRFSEEGPCRRRQMETSRSHDGGNPESEKRAAMGVPVSGRGERERGIGVYDSGVAEGKAKAMERKGSVNRFSEVEKKFEKLSTSEGGERGRHRSGMDHKGGFRRGIGNYGRWSNSYRSEAPRLSTRHGVVWVKKGEGSSGGDGKQEDDHGFSQCD